MDRDVRVYITGADGMVGTALRRALSDAGPSRFDVRGVSLSDFDIRDRTEVARSIEAFRPDVVVHAAANAVVDECETAPGRARSINTLGTANVAAAAKRIGARFVYLSSDYVFDGTSGTAYLPDDVPAPLSIYGLTKLSGEAIARSVPRHLVLRTSWVFGGADPAVDVVLDLVNTLTDGGESRQIADQFSTPTLAADLADAIVFLLTDQPKLSATLHVANHGRASWYDVGLELLKLVADRGERPTGSVVPIGMADCDFIGQRPVDSALDSSQMRTLGFPMPTWQDALGRVLAPSLVGAGQ